MLSSVHEDVEVISRVYFFKLILQIDIVGKLVLPCAVHILERSGARLTKAYDVTIHRYRNSYTKIEDSKMQILRCMGSNLKFSNVPIYRILNSYNAKYAFRRVFKIWRLMIS